MIKYDTLVDYYKIDLVYKKICSATHHKKKLVAFELNKFSNFIFIYKMLEERTYTHGKYNLFLIKYPKYRLIMSENIFDKIVDQLISTYLLRPLFEPRFLPFNVASRTGLGLEKGMQLTKKYLTCLKKESDLVYILKCDICNYFYSIDQDILFLKLKKIIKDEEILKLLKNILDSTNKQYIPFEIEKLIFKEIKRIEVANISLKEKEKRIKKLKELSKYTFGKGLPAGNMTSQLFALFYLNDFDHFVKEKLKIKYYVRYLDDFIFIHPDKEYLKTIKKSIEKELLKLNLHLNQKTTIFDLKIGFTFIGYKFISRDKKIYVLANKKIKKKIKKRYQKEGKSILKSYNGYLKRCQSGRFIYLLENKNERKG